MLARMFKRQRLSPQTRFEILKRDNHTCRYCGARAPGVELHIDHVEPVARGGRNDMENLATACSTCNAGKGARPLQDRSAFTGQLALPLATRVQTRPRRWRRA
jgi:5-methylcytosine-specific restriction endonuclease McrA